MFGETLRQARAHKRVTVKEAEQATRISRLYLSALEEENFEALPPLIYQRGIVRNYATYLDLDPNKLLAMYEEALGGVKPLDVGPAQPPLNMPSHWAPNFAIIAFILVLGMIVFAWFYSAFLAPGDPPPTATSPILTVTPLPTGESVEGQRLVESLIPTPTRAPNPTATPDAESVAAAATQTAEANQPEPTPTVPANTPEGDPALAGDGDGSSAASEPSVEESPIEEPPVPTGPTVTVVFNPTADIWLTVIDDTGYVWWDGFVPAGGTAGPFTAAYFDVYTSDVNDTWITNIDNNTTFIMNEAEGEDSFGLAPI
jgi:cytoskeletal protein RodZ